RFHPILPFFVYPLDNLHFFLTCHKWPLLQLPLDGGKTAARQILSRKQVSGSAKSSVARTTN
ncbi:hypothetical protein Q5692_40075, partial [Microcoleus sp. C2C3]|uniref:hypothetical protein n=1 Tax=unclassified Microcoleus TaxID=2642155 RepID=UPI002FCF3AC5